MATAKKSTKTSKTAHVLNVITGSNAADESTDSTPAAHVHTPVAPILEVARANDDVLANTILEALTAEVENDAPAPAEPTVPPEPLQAQAFENTAEPQSELPQAEVLPADLPLAAPESADADAAFIETAFLPPEDSPVVDELPKPGEKYYNVTQALVEEKAPKYMQMLDLCMCARCQADVKALALSNLAPKYIVMQPSQITPMFSVYEGKYGAAVTAQIISACRMVRDHPRH